MKGLYLLAGLLMGLTLGYGLAFRRVPASDPDACAHTADTFRCVRYLDNYDGDTIRFHIPGVHPLLGEKISVRVQGIDTPELRAKLPCEGARAKEAKSHVQRLLSRAKSIELRRVGRDKYFRVLADVVVDGRSLGTELIAARLAYPYDGGTKEPPDWCALARGQKAAPK